MQAQLDILSIENPLECQALRANLEWWGIRVNLFWIGKGDDLLEWNHHSKSTYIFLGCHGSEKGIHLPDLAPELADKQILSEYLRPTDVTQHLHFPDSSILLCNGCITGTESMADAFLEAGLSTYIAPSTYIEGDASLLFSSCFYYFLLCKGLSTTDAFQRASSLDQETKSFQMYS